MSGVKNLLLSIVIIVAAVSLVTFLVATNSPDSTVIRIGHDSKENSPLHQAMLVFEREVEKQSGDEIQVEIYPARQLGGVGETTEMVQQGNLQMTVGASVLLTSIVPEFNVLDLFYLFRDPPHAHMALDSAEVGTLLLESMHEKGFYGLGYMEVGFRNITTNKRPIQSLDDLSGLRIRAASNPTQIVAWESVGAAPIPLSWGEIFTSLQQGLINTQESAIYSIYAERFFEAQKYLSLTNHTYTNYVWFSNKAFWDSLSDSERQIVRQAALITIKHQRVLAAQQNRDIITELEQKGMQINTVDDDVRAEMKQRMNGAVYVALRDKTGRELFDRIVERINAMDAER